MFTKNHSLEEFRGNVSLCGEMFTNSDIHCPPLRGNIAYLVMSGGNLSSVESNLAYQRGNLSFLFQSFPPQQWFPEKENVYCCDLFLL